ncbi:MAG: hypothetical protein MZV64_70940 [Ignavibacteriales bacterium]|nr:hypothetical protein [Ignavibacteriales bacterium]
MLAAQPASATPSRTPWTPACGRSAARCGRRILAPVSAEFHGAPVVVYPTVPGA